MYQSILKKNICTELMVVPFFKLTLKRYWQTTSPTPNPVCSRLASKSIEKRRWRQTITKEGIAIQSCSDTVRDRSFGSTCFGIACRQATWRERVSVSQTLLALLLAKLDTIVFWVCGSILNDNPKTGKAISSAHIFALGIHHPIEKVTLGESRSSSFLCFRGLVTCVTLILNV